MPASGGIAPEDRHLPGLQVLRALAALAVVLFHAGRYLADQLPHALWRWGEFGVDVFFVLSGFVMVHATRDGTRVRDFLAARIARIAPLYWLATLGMAALIWLRPQLFVTAQLTPSHLLQSLLFLPHFSPSLPGQVLPLLVPGWTLNYEMYFYLLLGLLLPLRASLRVAIVTVLLLLGLLLAPRIADPTTSAWAQFLGAPLILEFALGMAAGLAYRNGWRMPSWAAFVAAIVGVSLVVIASRADMRLWTAGLGGLALLLSATRWDAMRAGWFRGLHRLGDASYSIYLLHPFVLGVVFLPVVGAALPFSPFVDVVVLLSIAFAASGLVGLSMHRCIERPLTRVVRRGLASRR